MKKRDVLETWFRRVWHEEDMAAIAEMLVPDANVTGLRKTPHVGPDEFLPLAQAVLSLIKDMRINIDDYMENGDRVSAMISITGKCRKTGVPLSFGGHVQVRIIDGKIVEGHNHIDFITVFEQLGLMPSGTLSCCLSGQKIA